MDQSNKHQTTIEPYHDIAICQPLRTGEKRGRIIIPESEPNVLHCLVLAVGPGVYDAQGKRIENPVKVDDVVMFLKSNSFDFWDGAHRHYAVRANMVCGRVRDDGGAES